MWDLLVMKVLLDRKGRREIQVLQGWKVHQEERGIRVTKVPLEGPEHLVSKGSLGLLVIKVCLDLQDLSAKREMLAVLVKMEVQVPKGKRVTLAHWVFLG